MQNIFLEARNFSCGFRDLRLPPLVAFASSGLLNHIAPRYLQEQQKADAIAMSSSSSMATGLASGMTFVGATGLFRDAHRDSAHNLVSPVIVPVARLLLKVTPTCIFQRALALASSATGSLELQRDMLPLIEQRCRHLEILDVACFGRALLLDNVPFVVPVSSGEAVFPSLTNLALRGAPVAPPTLRRVGSSLPNLSILHLVFPSRGSNSDAISSSDMAAVFSGCRQLRKLRLDCRELDFAAVEKEDRDKWFSFFDAVTPTLRELYLHVNSSREHDFSALARFVLCTADSKLELLELPQCPQSVLGAFESVMESSHSASSRASPASSVVGLDLNNAKWNFTRPKHVETVLRGFPNVESLSLWFEYPPSYAGAADNMPLIPHNLCSELMPNLRRLNMRDLTVNSLDCLQGASFLREVAIRIDPQSYRLGGSRDEKAASAALADELNNKLPRSIESLHLASSSQLPVDGWTSLPPKLREFDAVVSLPPSNNGTTLSKFDFLVAAASLQLRVLSLRFSVGVFDKEQVINVLARINDCISPQLEELSLYYLPVRGNLNVLSNLRSDRNSRSSSGGGGLRRMQIISGALHDSDAVFLAETGCLMRLEHLNLGYSETQLTAKAKKLLLDSCPCAAAKVRR